MKAKNLILEDKWRDLKSQEINIAEVRTSLLAKPKPKVALWPVALWPEPSPGALPEGGPLASGKLTLLSDQFFCRKR